MGSGQLSIGKNASSSASALTLTSGSLLQGGTALNGGNSLTVGSGATIASGARVNIYYGNTFNVAGGNATLTKSDTQEAVRESVYGVAQSFKAARSVRQSGELQALRSPPGATYSGTAS
jgi:hypothetical protein